MEGKRLNGGDTDQPICMRLYIGAQYTIHSIAYFYLSIIQRRLLKKIRKKEFLLFFDV